MNADMNQLIYSGKDLTDILACLSIRVSKKMTAYQLRDLLCWVSLLTITVQ